MKLIISSKDTYKIVTDNYTLEVKELQHDYVIAQLTCYDLAKLTEIREKIPTIISETVFNILFSMPTIYFKEFTRNL